MKNKLIVLFGLMVSLTHGQTHFVSPVTENLLNQQVEQINRTITIGDKFVVVKTLIDESTSDIQRLEIKEITRMKDKFGFNITYRCSSYDGLYPSQVKVYIAEKIKEIHLIQPVIGGEGNERYRFLID